MPIDSRIVAEDDPARAMSTDETLNSIQGMRLPRYQIGDYIRERVRAVWCSVSAHELVGDLENSPRGYHGSGFGHWRQMLAIACRRRVLSKGRASVSGLCNRQDAPQARWTTPRQNRSFRHRVDSARSVSTEISRLDNAAAESFFSTLEHERISRCRYTTRHQARLDIATWTDTWYNKKRLHSTNNMTSPTDYEHANQP